MIIEIPMMKEPFNRHLKQGHVGSALIASRIQRPGRRPEPTAVFGAGSIRIFCQIKTDLSTMQLEQAIENPEYQNNWMVVSNIFYFHPYQGNVPN